MIRTASLVTLVMALVMTAAGGCEKKKDERNDLPATGSDDTKGKSKGGKAIEAGVRYVPPK